MKTIMLASFYMIPRREMYLRVGNSASTEDSASGCRESESRIFWGYGLNGCVCTGVNTGADCSDLEGNGAPAC